MATLHLAPRYRVCRVHLLKFQAELPRSEELLGTNHLEETTASGGKMLLANHPLLVSRKANGSSFLASNS